MRALRRAAPEAALIAFFAALGLGEGLAQALLGVLLAAGIVAFLDQPRTERLLALRPLLSAVWLRLLLVFVVWAILTMMLNRHGLPRSRDGTKLFNLAPLLAVPLALARCSPRARERALCALLAALALASIFGYLQYRFGVMWLAKLSGTPEARWLLPLEGDPPRFMASGFFYNRLKFSGTLVAALAFTALTWQGLVRAARRFGLGCAGLAVVGLVLTFSRAATFALTIAVLVAWWLTAPSRRGGLLLLAAGAAVGLAAVFLVPHAGERLASIATSGAYSDRFFLWARAQEIIADHPWVGVGYGNYGEVCSPYYDRVDPTFVMRSQAHNQFLTVLAETGPVGLISFVAFLSTLAWASFKKARAGSSWARGAFAAVLAFLIMAFVHDPLFSPAVSLAFCATFGLGVSDEPGIT